MNQNDIIKMANAMQREREIQAEINRQAPLIDPARFEQSFNEIFTLGTSFREISFDGDEIQTKSIRTDQVLIDHGHTIHDF